MENRKVWSNVYTKNTVGKKKIKAVVLEFGNFGKPSVAHTCMTDDQ